MLRRPRARARADRAKPRSERLAAAEQRALGRLGAIESGLLDEVLPQLSRAADHGVLWLGVAGGMALSGRPGRRAAFRGLAALTSASVVSNVFLKRASRRPRPPTGLVPATRVPLRLPGTTSFPSGHAASAAAFATAVLLERPCAGVPLVPLAAAVAVSRVVIGVHYPSDVVAGVVVGVVVGMTAGVVAAGPARGGAGPSATRPGPAAPQRHAGP